MNAELISAAIVIVGVIFTAGKIVNSVTEGTKKELAAAKQDINRIGAKFRDLERVTDRRHHNVCMVLVAIQQDKDERFKIAGLLKED